MLLLLLHPEQGTDTSANGQRTNAVPVVRGDSPAATCSGCSVAPPSAAGTGMNIATPEADARLPTEATGMRPGVPGAAVAAAKDAELVRIRPESAYRDRTPLAGPLSDSRRDRGDPKPPSVPLAREASLKDLRNDAGVVSVCPCSRGTLPRQRDGSAGRHGPLAYPACDRGGGGTPPRAPSAGAIGLPSGPISTHILRSLSYTNLFGSPSLALTGFLLGSVSAEPC